MFVQFLSQGLCTYVAENTLVSCGATTAYVYLDACGPFANYQSPQESPHHHLNLVQRLLN